MEIANLIIIKILMTEPSVEALGFFILIISKNQDFTAWKNFTSHNQCGIACFFSYQIAAGATIPESSSRAATNIRKAQMQKKKTSS
jgi:hypothetical protein